MANRKRQDNKKKWHDRFGSLQSFEIQNIEISKVQDLPDVGEGIARYLQQFRQRFHQLGALLPRFETFQR